MHELHLYCGRETLYIHSFKMSVGDVTLLHIIWSLCFLLVFPCPTFAQSSASQPCRPQPSPYHLVLPTATCTPLFHHGASWYNPVPNLPCRILSDCPGLPCSADMSLHCIRIPTLLPGHPSYITQWYVYFIFLEIELD